MLSDALGSVKFRSPLWTVCLCVSQEQLAFELAASKRAA